MVLKQRGEVCIFQPGGLVSGLECSGLSGNVGVLNVCIWIFQFQLSGFHFFLIRVLNLAQSIFLD